ncbi:MAG: Crp/Fnr family transcriptional regulator, partial [Thermodesulfobacteriota bacterium]
MNNKDSQGDAGIPDVFKELSEQELDEFIGSGRQNAVKSGNVLFVQGDPADRCYLVKQGRLKLSRVNEDG